MEDTTTLSVIIATYNRAASLRDTLADLSTQVTGSAFTYEVVVIDNHSTDDTKAVVESLTRNYPVPLIYRFEPRPGKSYALNQGLEIAKGEFIVFTDDDVSIGPQWLSTLHDTFQTYHADGVGGPAQPLWLGPRPAWLGDHLLKQLGMIDHGLEPFRVSSPNTVFIGNNSAYRRSLFQRYGGFHPEDPTCDAEWFQRVFHAGHPLVYQPKAGLLHKITAQQMTSRAIARRFFSYGRGSALGFQRTGSVRTVCRIPLWVIRHYLELHGLALRSWLRGDTQEAMLHWLRRHQYLGMMYYCVDDWIHRRPMQRPRSAILQNAPSTSLKT